jgi:putative nucleotidyltransferase with HDIG domain
VSNTGNPVVRRAQELASTLLSSSQDLLGHAGTAAEQAASACARLGCRDTDVIVAAAWLHDIGYVPSLRATGYHPIDGALYLMKDNWPDRVISLVAHHSEAKMEAPYYSVAHHLSIIDAVTGPASDILTYSDMTSGASGGRVTLQARVEQMRNVDDAAASPVPRDVRESRYASLVSTTRLIGSQLST